jgi:phosphoribosylanthranilate isomerase
VSRLRDLGEWELWKAVRVRSGAEIRPAVRRFGDLVDLLLLDGWHPRLLGGTGRSFPWEALEEVRSGLPGELRLGAAGGLDPGNVGEAVRRLRPDLVDVSSGVESGPGVKDAERIRALIAAVREATGPLADER